MSTLYSRVGRPRPQGSRRELAIWILMRLTGLGLFVFALSHFLIVHVIFDPAEQTAQWITDHRWANDLWRFTDGTMLVLVVFHAFAGVRTVVNDYVGGPARRVIVAVLVVLALGLVAMGLSAILAANGPIP
jgi:succinate dehydrogenase / fumarate reductase membrane anchor subunit